MPDTLVELIRLRARSTPDDLAYGFLADGEGDLHTLTYRELERRAAAVAATLADRVAPGARVLLVFEPGLDFLTAFFGCLAAGVAAVPVYPPAPNRVQQGLANVARVAADCAAEAMLTSPLAAGLALPAADEPGLAGLPWLVAPGAGAARAAGADDAAAELPVAAVRSETVALLQYTSGSTGTPKGVVLRHRHLLANLESMHWFAGRAERGAVVSWLPMYHDMGLIGTVLYPLFRGMPGYLMSPLHFLARPGRWLELVSRTGATISGGPSFAYHLCVRRAGSIDLARLDLSRWEVAFNGAEPINAEVVRAFETAFAPAGLRPGTVVGCFGMAEAALLVTGARRGEPRFLSLRRDELAAGCAVPCPAADADAVTLVTSGRRPPGHDVRVVDPDTGRELPDGRVGELWFSGPSLADGYWSSTAVSGFGARLAGGDGDAGGPPAGYLRTGDLGFLRDGQLYVTGRLKDLVVVRGRNVYPHDVEQTVQRVDSRLRAGGGVVYAVAERHGEGLGVIQEVGTRDEEELRRLADAVDAAVTEQHQVPVTELHLVPPRSVLKTSSGKLRRAATRDALADGTIGVLHSRVAVAAATGGGAG